MAGQFPAGSVGAAREFLAAHTGLTRDQVTHYAIAAGDADELAAVVTCCDDTSDAVAMLRAALAALGSGAPVMPESRSVIVGREDLRAVLAVLAGSIPAAILGRFREALGEVSGGFCGYSGDWGESSRHPGLCSPYVVLGVEWHWELTGVRPLAESVPCKGKLGLWRLPEDIEKAVREQLEDGHAG